MPVGIIYMYQLYKNDMHTHIVFAVVFIILYKK